MVDDNKMKVLAFLYSLFKTFLVLFLSFSVHNAVNIKTKTFKQLKVQKIMNAIKSTVKILEEDQ